MIHPASGVSLKILSVNTGVPQSYPLDEKTVLTSMIRTPQKEIEVTFKKVIGDKFKTTSLHGTPDAVVYAYSFDRYAYWTDWLGKKINYGFFGENLSVDRLREEEFFLGATYEVGSTILRVTGPRYPCSKLNFVSGNHKLQEHFAEQGWPGVYFEVLQEGIIRPDDKLTLKEAIQKDVSVKDLFLAMRTKKRKEQRTEIIEKVLSSSVLLDKYRDQFSR